ncbi:MAG: ATP synthase subunit I [Erysipelotrichaceae bacterium]
MMEEKDMIQKIRKLHIMFVIILTILSYLIFKDFKAIGFGVIIGGLTSMMGFNSIVMMTNKIDSEISGLNRRIYTSYIRRYLMYALIFSLSMVYGVHPLALLAGFISNKLAINLYTICNKEGG